MRASQVALAIQDTYAIGKSLFIWGPPGVGKSSVVNQALQTGIDAGLWSSNAKIWDFRLIYRETVDMLGIPHVVEGRTVYAKPAGIPTDPNDEGILFFDEFNSAPQQTQGAGYQAFNEHRIGEHEISRKVHIIGAGNRANDRGIVHRMPDPLIDRMFHVDFEVNLDDWSKWALNAGVRPEVVAFLRFRSTLLHHHDTTRKCHAFATPRGWEDVSRLLNRASPIEAELIQGRVGDAAAGEFAAFLQLFRTMVSPDQILLNPLKAEVPTNPSILYALAEALARRASAKTFGAVMAYAERMPAEYAQCLVSSAVTITPMLCNTPEFIRFAASQS